MKGVGVGCRVFILTVESTIGFLNAHSCVSAMKMKNKPCPTYISCTCLSSSVNRAGCWPYLPWVSSPSLPTRVEDSNGRLLEAERRLQEERHHTVLLEQQLEKTRLEPRRPLASQKAPRNKLGRVSSVRKGGFALQSCQ